MKTRFWIALSLAATLILPAAAQISPSSSNQNNPPPMSQVDNSAQQLPALPQDQPPAPRQTPDQKAADHDLQARQPLTAERHEGFWGKINPFARKKYVQRQLGPIRERTNELDELTAANAKNIKDVDYRAQQGIQLAHNKANEADLHAVDAGNRAQAAQQTATQATTRLQTVEQVVTNIDQYKPVTQTEIRFRPGQTVLSKKAKDVLDDMANGIKDQKGYIVEIQGFSAGRGESAIESSQRMADAVRRYLVINNDIPVYRVHVLGLGNAPMPSSDGTAKRVRGARVEVSLLKNDLEQLSAPMSNSPTSNITAPATSISPATAQMVLPAQQSASPSTPPPQSNPQQ
ncbi:MAG: OmpA family protein [Acidobacteriia bacterium]|nr:OmpA family protein [Terriglobia bacterium]